MENNGSQNLNTLLGHIIALEKQKLYLWQKELSALPEGTLRCHSKGKSTFFYHAVGDRRTGISRDLDRVYALARKRYLRLLIGEHQDKLTAIRNELNGLPPSKTKSANSLPPIERLLDHYGRLGLDVARITCSREQYIWMKKSYVQNPMNPEQKVHETYSGIKVRSKSEKDIGNSLERRGIPYRYEQGIKLRVDWMEEVIGMEEFGYKIYYPDFVIMTATGRFIYWEHLGRVDQKRYREHNMEKIAAYRQDGLCDDEHLILTFERDLESTKDLERLIERRILPYM